VSDLEAGAARGGATLTDVPAGLGDAVGPPNADAGATGLGAGAAAARGAFPDVIGFGLVAGATVTCSGALL